MTMLNKGLSPLAKKASKLAENRGAPATTVKSQPPAQKLATGTGMGGTQSPLGFLADRASRARDAVRGAGQSVGNRVQNAVQGAVGRAQNTVRGVANSVQGRAQNMLDRTLDRHLHPIIERQVAPIVENVQGLAQQGQESLGHFNQMLDQGNQMIGQGQQFLQMGKEKVQGLAQQGQESLGRFDQMLDQGNQFLQMGKGAVKPWAGISQHLGGGLAGLLGVQGFNQPQWYQNLMTFLHQLFSGQWGRQGQGQWGQAQGQGQWGQQGQTVTASYNERKGASMDTTLTPLTALQLAVLGSEQFQKHAAMGTALPDVKLGAHLLMAKEMRKVAEMLSQEETTRELATLFQQAAEKVAAGYPARAVIQAQAGSNIKLAEQAMPLVGAMAVDLLMKRIDKIYQEKKAELIASKKK